MSLQLLNVDEVIPALVALHRQLTRPPFLDLRPRRGLVVDQVHLAPDGPDAGAACVTRRGTRTSQSKPAEHRASPGTCYGRVVPVGGARILQHTLAAYRPGVLFPL